MNKKIWNKSNAKKLFDCFMEIEKSQFPEYLHKAVDERKNIIERFILEFGADHVTICNYTNMMQFSSSITIDVFQYGRWKEGSININIGSEPQEYWANRINGTQKFDFEKWKWL
jgi:hypothetical protein